MSEGKVESGALVTGGLAGILASACCVGPLVLVSLGLGGAWVSTLTVLEPYRWVFFGIAVLALIFAWRKIYRPVGQCEPGQVCAVPRARRAYKITLWVVAALVLSAFASPYFAPLFY
ncbi:MAG: mercuric transport protein [Betaproteobacteria bacterium RIFCSPLOWO2_12_FULL_62_58]|nr:MAG: mercuric transport protein [Betaproteobacteria bacterium RIFCSPLOWO2_12_FULL_62_58]